MTCTHKKDGNVTYCTHDLHDLQKKNNEGVYSMCDLHFNFSLYT